MPVTNPGYRFPAEVIRHAVWLYRVFGLSLRDVELILAERGAVVSHESVRQWANKFGADFARRLRRRRPRPGDTWHMDEVFLRINGAQHYLWRAVDQHGVVLDILVQGRRNATAAKRFFGRLLAGLRYRPERIVTDGLRSYGAARREVLPEVRHRAVRYLNNRAENSHRPTRRRERQMQRFGIVNLTHSETKFGNSAASAALSRGVIANGRANHDPKLRKPARVQLKLTMPLYAIPPCSACAEGNITQVG